jgi:hypothetical protein
MAEPAAIRIHRRDKDPLWLDHEVEWYDYGLVFRDDAGDEHHFGFRDDVQGGGTVFTFVASYSLAGRDDAWYRVHEKLSEPLQFVAPTLGPRLSPVAVAALEHLAGLARDKGFASDPERRLAVQVFGALAQADESFVPDEVYVWGAMHGFDRRDADRLKLYAERALSGGATRTVGGRAIKVDRAQAKKMVEAWHAQIAD